MDSTLALPPAAWRRRAACLLVVFSFFAITFSVYGYSLRNRFITVDDAQLIASNPTIREFSFANLRTFFTTYDPELYIPLTYVSYLIDEQIGGNHPFIFHLNSLILHTLNALLVAWFAYLLSRKSIVGLFVGVIFAVHPLNTEAVMWAADRKDVLATFFFLASVIAFVLYRQTPNRRGRYWLSLGLFLLALLSKVVVLTLPAVLLLLDFRERRPWQPMVILEKIPYLLLSVLFGIVGLLGKQHVLAGGSPWMRVLLVGKSTVFYFEKLFLPVRLSIIYPLPTQISPASLLIPWIVLIVFVVITVYSLRHSRELAFGAFFYLAALAPVLLVQSDGVFYANDHYGYLPSIGIIYLGVIGSAAWYSRQHTAFRRKTAAVAGLIVVLLLSVLAFRQSLIWADSESLFEHTLTIFPDSAVARNNLAYMYTQKGDHEKAIEQLQAVLALAPDARAHSGLGYIYRLQGKLADSLRECQAAARLAPNDPLAHACLANSLAAEGRTEEAVMEAQTAITLDPKGLPFYATLGSLYLKKGDSMAAAAVYRKILAIDPYFVDAHYNLGHILETQNEIDAAIVEFEHAAELDAAPMDALNTLAVLYLKQNRLSDSIRAVQQTLHLDPRNETATFLKDTMVQHGVVWPTEAGE